MYLFLNNPSLKWAYYILLIGVLIYIIFEGKRKQRAIPIVHPLKNQTVDFTRTISNMYYENGKHKDIALHKVQHFLEYIRNTMYLQTSEINDSFIKNLAARSNNSLEDTQTLFKVIDDLKQRSQIDQKELERLNTLIDNFKSHNQWKKAKQ
jgi:light-regulated signal transduction histidine kinase (bacteriophytochrome)